VDFEDLINKLGGNSNAYTGDLNTNYFYYISSKELEKTLEVLL
jgi:secreted Zn-dependent insulinase-like peptidase